MDNKVSDGMVQFKTTRTSALEKLYSDEMSTKRRYDNSTTYSTTDYNSAAEIRKALSDAVGNKNSIIETSKKLFVTNPIYASIINYLTDMYTWKYKVIPHRVYTNSEKELNAEWSQDAQDELQDFIESQGIYIRQ